MMTRRARTGTAIGLSGIILLLFACTSHEQWNLKNITGVMPNLAFTLTDEDGKTVHGDKYLGKISLLYFGYTHCPDICPTTLSTISAALNELGNKRADVRVLFVSVDPARDSADVLKQYTNAFGPEFVGLRGSRDQLRAVTKRYRVTYGYDKPDENGNYVVSHSSAIFVFDRDGAVRLLGRGTDSPAEIAHDLRQLLSNT